MKGSVNKIAFILVLMLIMNFASSKIFFKDDIDDPDTAFENWIQPEGKDSFTCNLEKVNYFREHGGYMCGGVSIKNETHKNLGKHLISSNNMIEEFDTEGQEVILNFGLSIPLSIIEGKAQVQLLKGDHEPANYKADQGKNYMLIFNYC